MKTISTDEFNLPWLASLPEAESDAYIALLSDEQVYALLQTWTFVARDKQKAPPGNWQTWLMLAGRGWGKTGALAGWADLKAREYPGCRIAITAPTAADARDVLVLGDSGFMQVAPSWDKPHYSPTYRRLEWSNGSQGFLYSAEEPERLRGPQHHFAICDEIGAWVKPQTYEMLLFGMRLQINGSQPQIVIATTPRPSKLLKGILAEVGKTAVLTTGSTYENRANLAATFLDRIVSKYAGTRLGDQELEGLMLEDQVGALWKSWMFDADNFRVDEKTLPLMHRTVVSVDPAVSDNKESSEIGIVIAGIHNRSRGIRKIAEKQMYVLEDRSMSAPPEIWAQAVVDAFYEHEADAVVAEINNGGNLVTEMISIIDPNIPVKVVHASVSKEARAEPISGLYAQGKVHHFGILKSLEDQMLDWIPGSGRSPDRVDALTWAGHELMFGEAGEAPLFRQARARFTRRLNW